MGETVEGSSRRLVLTISCFASLGVFLFVRRPAPPPSRSLAGAPAVRRTDGDMAYALPANRDMTSMSAALASRDLSAGPGLRIVAFAVATNSLIFRASPSEGRKAVGLEALSTANAD